LFLAQGVGQRLSYWHFFPDCCRPVRFAEEAVPATSRGCDVPSAQAPTQAKLRKIGQVERQVDPPDTVVIPEVMIPVGRINAKRGSWLFHGRLNCDGDGIQRPERAFHHHAFAAPL